MRIGCNIVFKHLHFDFDFQPFETSSIIWVTMVATMLGCIWLSPPDHGHAYMVPRLLEVGFSLFSKRRKLYGHRPWAIATRHASSHTANDCMETWLGTCFRCFQSLAHGDRQWCVLQSYSSKMDRRSRWRSAKHVSACLFLQLHLSRMCCCSNMFRHVYFFSCTCQVCCSLAMFRHVYFFNWTCQVCAAFWTCFGMFISSAAPVRYVLLFGHVLACLFLQLHLSGMCSSLDMFWHVYFVNRTCQACLLLTHVLPRLFLLSNLPGMLCQPNMCVLFWTITGLDDTFTIVCLRINDIIVYNALSVSYTHLTLPTIYSV